MSSVREIRLHLEYGGGLRRVAKLVFTRQDASLYLVPYASRGEYFYGARTLGDQQATDTFDFREQLSVRSNPKLSIHESGQVHIYADGHQRAGPLRIAQLSETRGEHLATLQWDSVERLTTFMGKPSLNGTIKDCVFGVPNGVEGGALLIFANGERNAFKTERVHFAIEKRRLGGPPVFFGVAAVAKTRILEGGVTVLAGFDARKASLGEADGYLFLRGL